MGKDAPSLVYTPRFSLCGPQKPRPQRMNSPLQTPLSVHLRPVLSVGAEVEEPLPEAVGTHDALLKRPSLG